MGEATDTTRISFDRLIASERKGQILAGCTLLCMVLWVIRDYIAWIDFGTGGTPANGRGYLMMNKLRASRFLRGEDMKDASPIPATGQTYLKHAIPMRKGGHPKMLPRPLPQRQKAEPITAEAQTRLDAMMYDYSKKCANILTYGLSKSEKTVNAIYSRPEVPTCNHENKGLSYEVAHVHEHENSLHVLLSPNDARTVMASGWGQRFAVPEWVPSGWIMVYAPRNEEEVDLIESIVQASIAWSTGVRI